MSNVDHRNRSVIFDALRVLFVLSVFSYHYSAFDTPYWEFNYRVFGELQPWVDALGAYGFLGVPGFFIISGYFMKATSANRTPLQFANARLRRIGPSLIIVSALIYLLALAIGQRSPLSSLFFLSPTYGQPFLDTAFWSLWVEIRFYFIYCLYLLWRNHFPKFAAAPLGLAAVASIFQPWTGEFVNAFFITQYLPLFLLGIALHDFTKDRIRNSKNWSSLVVFLLVMSIESVSREAQISNQATKNQVSVVICAIVLVLVSILVWVAAHADFAQRQSKTSAKWARYLGPRTYQFYLVHLTSAGTITNILASSYGFLYNWGGICVFVVSLVLADATYRLSESGKLKQYFTLGKTRAF